VSSFALPCICADRFKIWSKDTPDSAADSILRDFGRGCLSLLERGFQCVNTDVDADGAAMPKRVGNRFSNAEDGDGDAADFVGCNSIVEETSREADDSQGRLVDPRLPILRADRDPNPARHLVEDTVKGESGYKADDTLGDSLGRLREGLALFYRRPGKLVETSAESSHDPLPLKAANGCGRNAGSPDFGEPRNPLHPQEGGQPGPLRWHSLRYNPSAILSYHPRKCIIANTVCIGEVGIRIVSFCICSIISKLRYASY